MVVDWKTVVCVHSVTLFWREQSGSCSQKIVFFCFALTVLSPKEFSLFHVPQKSLRPSVSLEKVCPKHSETNTQADAMGGRDDPNPNPNNKNNNKIPPWGKQQKCRGRPERKSWGVRFEGNKLFEKFLHILENLESHLYARAGNKLKYKKLRMQ